MSRALLISLCIVACACEKKAPRTPDRVMQDVQRFTVKVQQRSDESAKLCHRTTSAAAIAVANVLGPISRKETVSTARIAELDIADRAMQNACAQFR